MLHLTGVPVGSADIKAALARAYASGQRPTFLSVSPLGGDELWALGGTAFVVPTIPPNAPPELEYALRLRREALLEGICEECRATVGANPIGEVQGTGVAQALIPHRPYCLAADENVGPLMDSYYDSLADQDLETRLASASQSTRSKLALSLKSAIYLEGDDSKKWAQELLDAKLSNGAFSLCPHIAKNVTQTWNMLLGDDGWRCDQCWAYFNTSIANGAYRLPLIEDHTCDSCRRYSPGLTPLVVRVDHFVLYGGFCRRCGAKWEHGSERSKG